MKSINYSKSRKKHYYNCLVVNELNYTNNVLHKKRTDFVTLLFTIVYMYITRASVLYICTYIHIYIYM